MTTTLYYGNNQTVTQSLSGTDYAVGEVYNRDIGGITGQGPHVTLNLTAPVVNFASSTNGGWADDEWNAHGTSLTVNFQNTLNKLQPPLNRGGLSFQGARWITTKAS